MWMASCIHKGKTLNQQVVPAERVLEMVTVNGARALLWDDELGALEVGKKADIVVINPNSANMLVRPRKILCWMPHKLQPLHDTVANLVSSMQSRNVESVVINGHWVLKNGAVMTVN